MSKIKITVERVDGCCSLPVLVGDYFFVEDDKISVPEGKYACIWAFQSMMPVFPILSAKDKMKDPHWLKSFNRFCCPDPKGKVLYRLEEIDHDKN